MTPEALIAQDDSLTQERAGWDSWWDELTQHFIPSRTYRSKAASGQPEGSQFDRIYDTVGIESAEGLANMLTTQLSPAGQKWVSYSPPPPLSDDEEISDYYRNASAVVLNHVQHSNYYTERHESNLDKAGLGTSALFVRPGKRSLFQFKHIDLGTFNFEEDEEGSPSEIWRTFELTASQADSMFPILGTKVSQALSDPNKKHILKFPFLHYCGPNPAANPDKLEGKYKKVISRWICKTDKIELDAGCKLRFGLDLPSIPFVGNPNGMVDKAPSVPGAKPKVH